MCSYVSPGFRSFQVCCSLSCDPWKSVEFLSRKKARSWLTNFIFSGFWMNFELHTWSSGTRTESPIETRHEIFPTNGGRFINRIKAVRKIQFLVVVIFIWKWMWSRQPYIHYIHSCKQDRIHKVLCFRWWSLLLCDTKCFLSFVWFYV